MGNDIFNYRRKGSVIYLTALAVFVFLVCLCIGVFWRNGKSVTVNAETTYYFLARGCEQATSAAVAGEVYSSGGAGYLVETGGESLVVLACYYAPEDAETVQNTLLSKGVETVVRAFSSKDFALRGDMADGAARIKANLNTADTCARLLYDTANGLEQGRLTQKQARAAVEGVKKALDGLCLGNGERFSNWNGKLREAALKAEEISCGILFAKDLRYLQVFLCFSVLDAEIYFA